MKLTIKQLQNIIKEELVSIAEGRDIEDEDDWPWGTHEDDHKRVRAR